MNFTQAGRATPGAAGSDASSRDVAGAGKETAGSAYSRVSAGEPSRRVRGQRAFTLIELLVVLAILGVLAGLLLPALGRGKTRAQRVFCMGNLRQLALAGQMYWDDNEGQPFRYRGASVDGGDVYWFGWLERGVEGERDFDPSRGALFPYLGGRGVALCPSLRYHLAGFKLKAAGAAFGYGYNLHLSPPLLEPQPRIAALARPSRTVLFADAAQVNTFQPPASAEHPMLEEFYYVNASEPTAHFRHEHRAMAAFCDGHVAGEAMVAGSLDPRLSDVEVARLSADILLP